MNWMRLNLSDIVSASLLTSSVFGEAGYAHQQAMPTGKQANGELFDDLVLADDDSAELGTEPLIDVPQFVDGGNIVVGQVFHRRGKRGLRHASGSKGAGWRDRSLAAR